MDCEKLREGRASTRVASRRYGDRLEKRNVEYMRNRRRRMLDTLMNLWLLETKHRSGFAKYCWSE